MRIKAYYHDGEKKIKISCLKGKGNNSNHIIHDVPDYLKKDLEEYLSKLIREEDNITINTLYQELNDKFKEIKEIRKQILSNYHAKIRDKLSMHKEEFPELYL